MPDGEKKGITVRIDAGLHAEVSQYLKDHGMTMAEFVTLAGLESEVTEYDEDLIRSLVEKITVKSETEIEIRLSGGLTLTEHLPSRKRRCKRK